MNTKKIFPKFFILVLAISLSFAMAAAPASASGASPQSGTGAASAAGPVGYGQGHVELLSEGGLPETILPIPRLMPAAPEGSTAPLGDALSLEDTLKAGLEAGAESIDISAFQLQNTDESLTQLLNIYSSVLNSNPQYFYVSAVYGYSYSYYDNLLLSLNPTYKYTGSERLDKIAEFNSNTQKVLASIPSGVSDMQEALAVNDYFAVNFQYSPKGNYNYSPEVLFSDLNGVCQAYSLAYEYVMMQLGIPCKIATSSAMNHAWNVVQIGGNWYHLDVTWDDPIPDLGGRAGHQYFLHSDAAISDTIHRHHDWDLVTNATSTLYDNYFWSNVNNAFAYLNGYYYFINYAGSGVTQLCQWDGISNNVNVIYFYSEKWMFDTISYWNGSYAGVIAVGGKLLFSTPSGIYSIDPTQASPTPSLVLSPSLASGNSLYGFYIQDGNFFYTASNSPSVSGTAVAIPGSVFGVTAYTISATAGAGGTVSGGRVYNEDTRVTLVAEPDPGCLFDGWYEGGTKVSGDAYYSFTADSDRALEARFIIFTYTAEISPTAQTFAGATTGYSAQAAQPFTITSTGTGTLIGLSASLASGAGFEIVSALDQTTLSPNTTATVSVRPKTGLAAGTYTDTLRITGNFGISLSAPLSFTVKAATGGTGGGKGTGGGTGGGTGPGGGSSATQQTQPAQVTDIRSAQTTLYVAKGKTLTIPYAVDLAPGSTKLPALTWTSSAPANVTVDQSGKVKGLAAGKSAKITIASDSGFTKTFTVKVEKAAVKVTSITVSKPPKTLKVGATAVLKVKVSPSKATGAVATFKSSKSSVLTVDKAGKVTAIAKGTAKITVKAGGKSTVVTFVVK